MRFDELAEVLASFAVINLRRDLHPQECAPCWAHEVKAPRLAASTPNFDGPAKIDTGDGSVRTRLPVTSDAPKAKRIPLTSAAEPETRSGQRSDAAEASAL